MTTSLLPEMVGVTQPFQFFHRRHGSCSHFITPRSFRGHTTISFPPKTKWFTLPMHFSPKWQGLHSQFNFATDSMGHTAILFLHGVSGFTHPFHFSAKHTQNGLHCPFISPQDGKITHASFPAIAFLSETARVTLPFHFTPRLQGLRSQFVYPLDFKGCRAISFLQCNFLSCAIQQGFCILFTSP